MVDLNLALSQAVAGSHTAESLLISPPQLAEFLPVAIFACEAAGRLRWFNTRAAQLWGRFPKVGEDVERLSGRHQLFALDGSSLPQAELPLARVLRTGEAAEGVEGSVERPDGTRVVVTMHICALRDADGNVIGAIACLHGGDRTARLL